MRQSNTGHRNVTYDSTRAGPISVRNARRQDFAYCALQNAKAALEIREAWAKERGELEGNGAKVAPSGGKAPFSIERRAVTLTFD